MYPSVALRHELQFVYQLMKQKLSQHGYRLSITEVEAHYPEKLATYSIFCDRDIDTDSPSKVQSCAAVVRCPMYYNATTDGEEKFGMVLDLSYSLTDGTKHFLQRNNTYLVDFPSSKWTHEALRTWFMMSTQVANHVADLLSLPLQDNPACQPTEPKQEYSADLVVGSGLTSGKWKHNPSLAN